MNICGKCRRDFASLGAFDKHQDVDYKRDPVIICQDPETLGMEQNAHGRWRVPFEGEPWWKTSGE